jgi:hypothetical protein
VAINLSKMLPRVEEFLLGTMAAVAPVMAGRAGLSKIICASIITNKLLRINR